MPELAEVEHTRRLWNVGIDQPIREVVVHKPAARVLRKIDVALVQKRLKGQPLTSSAANGKQMIFRFGKKADRCLGVHLGMEGMLRVEAADFQPAKHDYLLLRQATQSLIFSDHRLFGLILYFEGAAAEQWWKGLPPAVTSDEFTLEAVTNFVQRRKGTALKPLLLMQERFPGVGNWMADEILWRAGLHPELKGGDLDEKQLTQLWAKTREVCELAIVEMRADWNYPDSWLFPHRWEDGGTCPKCGSDLERKMIGGRRTCWCPRCQPRRRSKRVK